MIKFGSGVLTVQETDDGSVSSCTLIILFMNSHFFNTLTRSKENPF
jgi:hypothetical protein